MGMAIDKAIEDLKASKRWKCKPSNECIDIAIKALEQSPCEDAISRQAAIEEVKQYWYKPDIAGALAELPSVYPRQRTGHWIEGQTDNPNIHNILCSCCCEGYPSKGHANSQYTREKFKYCPNCGAKMIEPQSEE